MHVFLHLTFWDDMFLFPAMENVCLTEFMSKSHPINIMPQVQFHSDARTTFQDRENKQPIPKVIKNWGPLREVSVNVQLTFDESPLENHVFTLDSLLNLQDTFSLQLYFICKIYMYVQTGKLVAQTHWPNSQMENLTSLMQPLCKIFPSRAV